MRYRNMLIIKWMVEIYIFWHVLCAIFKNSTWDALGPRTLLSNSSHHPLFGLLSPFFIWTFNSRHFETFRDISRHRHVQTCTDISRYFDLFSIFFRFFFDLFSFFPIFYIIVGKTNEKRLYVPSTQKSWLT